MKKRFIRAFATLFYPNKCPFCSRVIAYDETSCAKCRSELSQFALKCFASGGYKCAARFMYSGVYSSAIKQFKFGKKYGMAHSLGSHTADAVGMIFSDAELAEIDCVTFVPMYLSRFSRGVNYAELIAKHVAELLGKPCEELLIKSKRNRKQHSLNKIERRENVRGVFSVKDPKKVRDRHILIVDDIITTGNTLGECAKKLEKGGAAKVICAAFCGSAS